MVHVFAVSCDVVIRGERWYLERTKAAGVIEAFLVRAKLSMQGGLVPHEAF